jgi:hypothetical protein
MPVHAGKIDEKNGDKTGEENGQTVSRSGAMWVFNVLSRTPGIGLPPGKRLSRSADQDGVFSGP